MYELTQEQQQKLATILMEYLNKNDWKGLFTETGSEEFAKQNTQFYDEDQWENDNIEQDCADSLAHILNKDASNLKIVWEIPGVQAMTKRKDEVFHQEVNSLIEAAELQVSAQAISALESNDQNPYEILDEAKKRIDAELNIEALALTRAALRNHFQRLCEGNAIETNAHDTTALLLAKLIDTIKQKSQNTPNQYSLSMLGISTIICETIESSHIQMDSGTETNKAEANYAINQSRSLMLYLDDLLT